MPSHYETFFGMERYAVVGHSAKGNFPKLSYRGLRKLGKTVYPVDPSVEDIEGVATFADLAALPEKVDGVLIEVPKDESADWIAKAADAGIQHAWLHMGRDTPEAVKVAEERGVDLRKGTCAVMYVTPQFTYHSIHRGIMKLLRKY